MSDSISRSDDSGLARRLIDLTQAGLPLVPDPWGWIAEQLGISPEDSLALLQRLQADGAIRRIAAVPNHYRLGYRHNGMTVWDVDDDQLAELGPLIGAQHFVSHCYRRPRRDGWRYNLFAMVHGRSAEEIDTDRERIRQLLGSACRADSMLVSSRILKKTGLRLPPTSHPTPASDTPAPSSITPTPASIHPIPSPDTPTPSSSAKAGDPSSRHTSRSAPLDSPLSRRMTGKERGMTSPHQETSPCSE